MDVFITVITYKDLLHNSRQMQLNCKKQLGKPINFSKSSNLKCNRRLQGYLTTIKLSTAATYNVAFFDFKNCNVKRIFVRYNTAIHLQCLSTSNVLSRDFSDFLFVEAC